MLFQSYKSPWFPEVAKPALFILRKKTIVNWSSMSGREILLWIWGITREEGAPNFHITEKQNLLLFCVSFSKNFCLICIMLAPRGSEFWIFLTVTEIDYLQYILFIFRWSCTKWIFKLSLRDQDHKVSWDQATATKLLSNVSALVTGNGG